MIIKFNEPYATVHAYVVNGSITGCEWQGKVGQDAQGVKRPPVFLEYDVTNVIFENIRHLVTLNV